MPQVACGNVKSIQRSTNFAQAPGKDLNTSASHGTGQYKSVNYRNIKFVQEG